MKVSPMGNSASALKAVQAFDSLPDSALIDIATGTLLTGRSRSSFYRDFDSGLLTLIKIGRSTRIKVGELRRIMSGVPA